MFNARYIAFYLDLILKTAFMNKRFFLFVKDDSMCTAAGIIATKQATIIDTETCRFYYSTYAITAKSIEFEDEYFVQKSFDECADYIVKNSRNLVNIDSYATILKFSRRIEESTKGF